MLLLSNHTMQSSSNALNWRYAVKKYDTTKKLTAEQLQIVKDSLRLAASSYGLEAWNFIHVTNPELRVALRAAGYDQSGITDASELFVLATRVSVDAAYADSFINDLAKSRGIEPVTLDGYKGMVQGAIARQTPEDLKNWLAHQVYVALGFALATLAHNATPMEGFDSNQFDEILGLKELGLHAQVIMPVGFRAADDSYAQFPKYRKPESVVFIER